MSGFMLRVTAKALIAVPTWTRGWGGCVPCLIPEAVNQ
jgi:hypothetical protein